MDHESVSMVSFDPIILGLLMFQGVLFVFFIRQTRRSGRTAYSLTLALAFGVVAATLALVNTMDLQPDTSVAVLATELVFYSLEYLFVYLFFEQSATWKPNVLRLGTAVGLTFGTIAFHLNYWLCENVESDVEFLWDTCYAWSGILLFGMGIWVNTCL